ncbi:MAG: ATP-binding protein [Bacteroidetes bacterium]|nr:MAG: ATP-binding protein [Bacteroidota bacterium]
MKTLFHKIEKYNCWDGKYFDTGYERKTYLKDILKYQGNKLVKVLVGQRRVGKSYILRQIMSFLRNEKNIGPKNIFYLNKEYIAFDEIETAKDLENIFGFYKAELKVTGKIYIFLDEVQNIDGWETFVNSNSQDFTEEYELFISGSNSNLLSGELATLLSGRYIEFEIFPFDLFEFADYKSLNINRDTFLQYLQNGGLPELFNFEQTETKHNYIASLKNTIILRDIVSRYKVKDVDLLENILKFLFINIGNLTSFTSIVKYFKSKQKKTNYETISTYVNYLKNTFIIHECERYNLRGKQVLGGERKYFLNDLAFKNLLSGFFPDDIGYHLENYVFMQLKRMHYNVKVGVFGDKEVDFVAQKGDKTIYVQVAYLLSEPKTVEREFGNLLKIKDNFEKFVVSLDEAEFSDYQGIKHIKPWELY